MSFFRAAAAAAGEEGQCGVTIIMDDNGTSSDHGIACCFVNKSNQQHSASYGEARERVLWLLSSLMMWDYNFLNP
jgi:hypothetical protein